MLAKGKQVTDHLALHADRPLLETFHQNGLPRARIVRKRGGTGRQDDAAVIDLAPFRQPAQSKGRRVTRHPQGTPGDRDGDLVIPPHPARPELALIQFDHVPHSVLWMNDPFSDAEHVVAGINGGDPCPRHDFAGGNRRVARDENHRLRVPRADAQYSRSTDGQPGYNR